MSEINVEVTQSDITANVTSPNITATVTNADVAANVTTSEVTAEISAANVTVNITGGGSPHIIQDEGVAETQRDNLNFVGAGVSVSDDSANNATVVTISGGGGGGTWGTITGTLSDQTDLQTALDGKVDENAAITGATKTKITYDAKGLVTAGADAAISDITGLQTALDGKADSAHTHPLSDITQSGATLNQIPKWNGSAWVPADDETGGGAGITEYEYVEMQTAIADGDLTPGAFYRITDAAGTDLGFICQAVTTNEITVNGTGGYLNADFQAVGDYANTPQTFGTQLGIWRPSFEAVNILYLNLTGGTFVVGDTITGGTTGATAVVVTDDGAASMTAYMTSAGVAFDGSEVLDNGNGVTADMDGAAGSPTIVLGDVVIWNLLNYQLTDAAQLNGDSPENNTDAYTLLDKATYAETYVTAWDVSEFDFANNWLQYRSDSRGNLFRYGKVVSDATGGFGGGEGVSAMSVFQWGRDSWYGNIIDNGYISGQNALCSVSENIVHINGRISRLTADQDSSVTKNTVGQFSEIDSITLIGTALVAQNYLIGGSIVDCTINSSNVTGNTLTYASISNCIIVNGVNIAGNNLYANAAIDAVTLSNSAAVNENTLSPGAQLTSITATDNTAINSNILENGASITDITAGANCEISRNKIGQGATLGGSTTMGDGAQFNDLDIRANKQVSNKTLDAGVTFSDKIVQLTTDATEAYSANVEGNRVQPGFSDIEGTLDITGLTAIDFTAAWAQYRGIYNLTSSNATETISADSLTNFPTLFPFRLVPASGLVLTLTCTAAASATNGSIVGSAATIVLDGSNGDFVELEADSTGTFVRVKNLQVYS